MHNDQFVDSIRRKKSFACTVVFIVCVLIVFFQGLRFSDPDYPSLIAALFSSGGSSIPPTKGYLIEGLLGDFIGLAYLTVGLKGFVAQLAWWISGLALLAAAIAFSVKNRSTTIVDVVLIISFTRLIDTLSVWGGKFDPYLLAFLVLTANKDKRIALSGIVLAAFTHPLVALISTVGVVLVEATFSGLWFRTAIATVLLAAIADITLFHYLFPALMDRPDIVLTMLPRLLRSGLHWGLPSFVSALLLPFFFIQFFKPRLCVPKNGQTALLVLWVLFATFTSCVFALDHTRVASLLTVAPLIIFLRWQDLLQGSAAATPTLMPNLAWLFVVLFLARLIIPHFDEFGPHLFWWEL